MHAGEADPYKKPRVPEDELADDLDEQDALDDGSDLAFTDDVRDEDDRA